MVIQETAPSPPSLICEGEESTEDDQKEDQIAVLHDDLRYLPDFGNVSVTNSCDVHFGNKNFYQGPVTIKQFVCADGSTVKEKIDLDVNGLSNGLENPVFIPDFPIAKSTVGSKPATQENDIGISRGLFCLKRFTQKRVVIVAGLLGVFTLSLVILVVVLLLRHNGFSTEEDSNAILREDTSEQEKNTPVDSPLDPSGNLSLPDKLKLVSRIEWLAQPPTSPATPLPTPVPYVIIQHTATENCSSQAQCIFHVRYIQTFHIESKNWWDIGYNFLVGGDGEAYEGRGWLSEGAHTYGYNSRSIGIAFIGTFNTVKPPQRQIKACKLLIKKGVELGYIKKDYKLLAARQLQTTQSPGKALYEDMKTWDHWARQP